MRSLLVIALLFTAACAKQSGDSTSETCAKYTSAYMIKYPDKVVRKSDVYVCDGYFKAVPLSSDAQAFTSDSLTERIMHVDDSDPSAPVVTYYFTEFQGE